MDVTSPRTLRSPVKILSDNNLALTPDRQHEIAEGMVALLMAKEGARYMAAVVREGFIQLGSPAWAEIFLKEDRPTWAGLLDDAPVGCAAPLRLEGRGV